MTAGGIWLGIGLAAIAAAGALWHIAVLLVMGMAVGATLAGSLPANALIVRRFSESPAWALGIASTGTSLGGVLIPPIAAALLLSATSSTPSEVMDSRLSRKVETARPVASFCTLVRRRNNVGIPGTWERDERAP